MPLFLQKLNLTQFRGYDALRLDVTDARIVVLTGPNGAGKTNVLEAISLLTPGRGLRSADLLDLKNRAAGPKELWAVAAEIETAGGQAMRLGTGLDRLDKGVKRRVVRIDGKDARSQSALSEHMSVLWLTPQMDRLFLEGASARRKFFDRLVYACEPEHAARLNRYEKKLRERMKLLQQDRRADPAWLDALETQLAGEAVSIAAARLSLLERMEAYIARLAASQSLFPAPQISVSGQVEQDLAQKPALEVEEDLRRRYHAARAKDAVAGRSSEGIHRGDFLVRYAAKDLPADQCSTGEQKGLLISIVLAHALMMQGEKGFVPVLLLDEVAAHLDDARREQLFAQLVAFGGQVWLTGTDVEIFKPLEGKARFFTVRQAQGFSRVQAEKPRDDDNGLEAAS
ncbi:MAG: DNA replication/repair protein RecF [Alphaproteobacteria bacterium]|nr:DNA replication/repair protein RecF [Alphaproteobacteria bacterium]